MKPTLNLGGNHRIDILLYSLFCSLVTVLLIYVFPSPFYFIGGGAELNSSYDSEIDYLANITSTLVNGHPMDFLHPGVTLNYVSLFVTNLFAQTDSVEEIIHATRASLLLLVLV